MEMVKFLGFAILASLVLIVLAKVIMQKFMRKPVDYYDKEEQRQDDLVMKLIRSKKGANQ